MTPRRWLPPALWAALILVLTSLPVQPEAPAGISHLDKLAHFVLYAGQGWLVTRALRTRRWPSMVAALLAIGVFAALDEWHQRFFLRDPDTLDWIADMVGASVGIALASRVRGVEAVQ